MKIKIFTLVVFLLLFLGGFSAVFGYIAVDPTRTIPNARVLGLGKAYNALANDCGSLYTNPSGMADAENWQMTSMSGTFLDEFNFLSFSGIYPTDYGSFGIGYAGTSISGAWATTLEAGTNLDDPIYTIDQNQDPMSYQNSAYILSYANQLKEVNFLKQYPLVENVVNNLSVGGNIKIFNVRLAGDGIQNGNAAGTEVDLGAKYYPPQKWMKFGLTFQNLLPMSMGGKLTYASGHTESYPLVVEGGSVFNILGKDDSLYEYGEHDIKMMLDFDMHPTLTGYPMAWHLATEWFPIPMVAIRAGLDQDAGDDGNGNLIIYSDMAYGVGLRVGGFNFDYAYHTFAGAPNINNSYFSMSYGLIPKPKAPEEPIIVGNPEDKLITFANKVDVIGAVVEPDIRYLTLNGVPLKFSLRGDFKADVDLRVGRNPIVLEGKDKEGKTIRIRKLRILRSML